MKVKKKLNVKVERFENIETVTGFRLQVSRKSKRCVFPVTWNL